MAAWLKSIFGGSSSSENDVVADVKIEDSAVKNLMQTDASWIGVDLDGTLAEYSKWKGLDHVGKPIPLMQKRVMQWLEAGHKVKILTARASVEEGIPPVEKWLAENGFPPLEVTNQKDFHMIELWDDRAIQVVRNTGRPVIRPSMSSNPQAPLFKDENAGETFEYVPTRTPKKEP
jgi:hypothetical protein